MATGKEQVSLHLIFTIVSKSEIFFVTAKTPTGHYTCAWHSRIDTPVRPLTASTPNKY